MIIYIFEGVSFLTSWRPCAWKLERFRKNVNNIIFLSDKNSNLLYILNKCKSWEK